MIEIKNDNDMIITKEDGTEQLLKILFYFHNDQRDKDYYFLYEEGNEDDIIVLGTKDGETMDTLTDEELDEADQVLEAYESDPTIQGLKEAN